MPPGAGSTLVQVLRWSLGVGAATSESRAALVGGLAAAFAESSSMAAVAFALPRTLCA